MQSANDRNPTGVARSAIDSLGCAAFAFAAFLATGIAVAGDIPAQMLYRQDHTACDSGQSNQDRATCLREAGAALQEAGAKSSGDSQGSYEQNRVKRCEVLPAADREDCLRRMHGQGSVSGSVESGGIYRELHTTLPAK
jgi:hypothetical protein